MTDMEESPLLTVFSDDPFIKIVDTLLDHPNYGYTKKELAEVNGIAWKTVNKQWKRLEKESIELLIFSNFWNGFKSLEQKLGERSPEADLFSEHRDGRESAE